MEPTRTGFGAGATTMALGPSQECACAQSTVTPCVLLVYAGRGFKQVERSLPRTDWGGGPILLGLGRVVLCAGKVARPVPSFVGGKGNCGDSASLCWRRCPRRADERGPRGIGRKNTRNVVRA